MRHIESAMTLLAVCLLGIAATAAHAEHGRDFSASYTLGAPRAVDATHVAVPIALRLHNHSGADVTNATVSLGEIRRQSPAPQPTGSTTATAALGVAVKNRAVAAVTTALVVSNREYERWQHGGRPLLALRTRDRFGHTVLHPIEANPAVSRRAAR
jgi:hypothetical protein